MGRDSASPHTGGVHTRAWDALFIAAAPVVMLSGLINWDMLAVALCSISLLLWARKHPMLAGVVIGLAASAKFYPIALVAVFFVLCLRSARMKSWGLLLLGSVLSFLAVNLPTMLTAPKAWAFFWMYSADRASDYGSIWYVISMMGLPIGSTAVTVTEAMCLAISGGVIVGLALSAPRRPRVGQIALLVLVAFLVFNKVYSPQYVLWLLPIVVLARPVVFDLLVFTASESLYYFSIWGLLGGGFGSPNDPAPLYWLAVMLRIGVQIWLVVRVVNDMWHPWLDPVRGPFVDDPIGGVLNHAPDAPWLLMMPRPVETPVAASA